MTAAHKWIERRRTRYCQCCDAFQTADSNARNASWYPEKFNKKNCPQTKRATPARQAIVDAVESMKP